MVERTTTGEAEVVAVVVAEMGVPAIAAVISRTRRASAGRAGQTA